MKAVKLPFDKADLEPYITADQISVHYDSHYKKYIETCNELTKQLGFDPDLNAMSLMLVTKDHKDESDDHTKLCNAVCQVVNHELYWNSLNDNFHDYIEQYDHLHEAVQRGFGTTAKFTRELKKQVTGGFGSNWVYLCYFPKTKAITWITYHDAENPYVKPHKETIIPLLTVDTWEHAFYVQFQADKKAYFSSMLKVLNWKHADKQISEHEGQEKVTM